MRSARNLLQRRFSGRLSINEGSAHDEEEEDPTYRPPSEVILDKLKNNYNVFFSELVLGDEIIGVDYILLLRALCYNATVRHVTITNNFLGTFNTDEIRILLEVVGGMPKLESLTIYFFPEMPMQARTVANVLNRTKNLRELHFYDLELAGDDYDLEPLGEAVEALRNLRVISLNQLGLEEEEEEMISPDHLVNSLSKLPLLEEVIITTRRVLNWDDDSLGGLCSSQSLKSLKLKNMNLDKSQVSSISSSLQTETSTLTHLHLSNCGIDVDGWRAVAGILPENATLMHLDLSQCNELDDDTCTAIASCMEKNNCLKILQLYNDEGSKVTSRGVTALCRMLEKNTTLECFEISYQGDDSNGFRAVAQALTENDSLKKLYIENHSNSVDTSGVVAIGKALECENTALEQIAIVYSGADDEGVIALAQAIRKSSTLKHFTFNKAEYRSHVR